MTTALARVDQEIERLQADLQPASKQESLASAKLLLGAYPKREFNDPAIFVRMLTAAFAKFPVSLHLEAVDRITDQLKFVPTKADVVETLKKLAAPRWRELRDARARRETLRDMSDWRPPTVAEKAEVAEMVREARRITNSATLACTLRHS